MPIDRRAVLRGAVLAGAGWLPPARGIAGDNRTAATPSELPSAIVIRSKGSGSERYNVALDSLRTYMVAHLEGYGLPGMTCSVADRDGFSAIINAGWSNVDEREAVRSDHLFQIGSISKSFASICVLKAVSEGKVNLDDTLTGLLPDVPLSGQAISIRQLLSHTSGLAEDVPIFPLGGSGKLWTGYEPGARFSYSNTGYVLLGAVLERLYGEPYEAIVERVVLTPLHMRETRGAIRVADVPHYAAGYWPFYSDRPIRQRGPLTVAYFTEFTKPSGCIAATAGDMSRYVQYLIQAGMGVGGPLLNDWAARQLTTPVTAAPVYGPTAEYAMGLGVVPIGEHRCLHHTGGMTAFSSAIHVDPTAGVGAFVSANASVGDYRPRDVSYFACEIMRAARERGARPLPPPIRHDDRVADAIDFVASYRSDSGDLVTFRQRQAGLFCDFRGEDVAVEMKAEDAFLLRHRRFERLLLTFRREGGQPITAWWGETRFTKAGAPASKSQSAAPEALSNLAGYYSNNDPWAGRLMVFAQDDRLWLDGTKPLVPLADGSYRVGADPSGCERVVFEARLNGRAHRLLFSGVVFDRDSSDIPNAWRKPG
jgi:CubicO group peptidase (beta-lactamase class C family)